MYKYLFLFLNYFSFFVEHKRCERFRQIFPSPFEIHTYIFATKISYHCICKFVDILYSAVLSKCIQYWSIARDPRWRILVYKSPRNAISRAYQCTCCSAGTVFLATQHLSERRKQTNPIISTESTVNPATAPITSGICREEYSMCTGDAFSRGRSYNTVRDL